ncbi:hypothetical protein [Pustulibacterium marinum]|nr:hypothetical protein [Pustulibacterium marinum]
MNCELKSIKSKLNLVRAQRLQIAESCWLVEAERHKKDASLANQEEALIARLQELNIDTEVEITKID